MATPSIIGRLRSGRNIRSSPIPGNTDEDEIQLEVGRQSAAASVSAQLETERNARSELASLATNRMRVKQSAQGEEENEETAEDQTQEQIAAEVKKAQEVDKRRAKEPYPYKEDDPDPPQTGIAKRNHT